MASIHFRNIDVLQEPLMGINLGALGLDVALHANGTPFIDEIQLPGKQDTALQLVKLFLHRSNSTSKCSSATTLRKDSKDRLWIRHRSMLRQHTE